MYSDDYMRGYGCALVVICVVMDVILVSHPGRKLRNADPLTALRRRGLGIQAEAQFGEDSGSSGQGCAQGSQGNGSDALTT